MRSRDRLRRAGRRLGPRARHGLYALGPILLLLVLPAVGALPSGPPSARGTPAPGAWAVPPKIAYASSVDGWNLSYYEWLPAGYNASRTYPLIIYLHGQENTNGTWIPGGLDTDIVSYLNATSPVGTTVRGLVNTASAQGFILIALNSRSGSGWYINSPCGGPQQQDVLDAIQHERSLRHISRLYLFGMSMGTEGTLSFAAAHPIFSGIGIIAPVTDLFEDVAYRLALGPNVSWAATSLSAKAQLFCGVLPGTGNASSLALVPVYEAMSPLRFDPTVFRHVPIYVTAGGIDFRAPDNVSIWPFWLNINNTFVNATCNVALSLGEPPTCSSTMETLHQQAPNDFRFRFVFEPHASHVFSQLDPADMIGYWQNAVPGGYFTGGFPFATISAAPHLAY